ncbi:hypothetical protein LTS18_003420, partial [Coniosporium uncinatum]
AGDPAPSNQPGPAATSTKPSSGSAGMGVGLYAIILIGGIAAFGAYQYLQSNSNKQ